MDASTRRVGPALVSWTDAATTDLDTTLVLGRAGASQITRHQRLTGRSATRFVAGRWLMGELIGELTGSDEAEISSLCPRCGGDHGPPRATRASVALSVSYAESTVVVAAIATTDASAIGVDVEAVRASDGPLAELAPLFSPHAIPPDLRGWTLIEAAVKADGRGMRIPPARVRSAPGSGGILPGAVRVVLPGRDEPLEVAPVEGPAGHLVSVAVAPPAPARSRCAP